MRSLWATQVNQAVIAELLVEYWHIAVVEALLILISIGFFFRFVIPSSMTDRAAIVLGHPVAAGRLFAQEGSDAGAQHFEIECQVFGLAGECEVARDDEVQVVDSGRSDVKHAGYLEGEGSERL